MACLWIIYNDKTQKKGYPKVPLDSAILCYGDYGKVIDCIDNLFPIPIPGAA